MKGRQMFLRSGLLSAARGGDELPISQTGSIFRENYSIGNTLTSVTPCNSRFRRSMSVFSSTSP